MTMEKYIRDMREQQLLAEATLAAQGIDPLRVDWVYSSEQTAAGVTIRSTPRLKTDEEMIGRCSDPSCCG